MNNPEPPSTRNYKRYDEAFKRQAVEHWLLSGKSARLGSATNRLFCVSATCVEPPTFMTTGWTFGFSDTNGQIAQVKVFFDKNVYIDPRITEPLK
jgi:hypothetical protein